MSLEVAQVLLAWSSAAALICAALADALPRRIRRGSLGLAGSAAWIQEEHDQ